MKNLFKYNTKNLAYVLFLSLLFTCGWTEPTENHPTGSLKIATIKSNSLENCLYFKDLTKKWEKEFKPRGEQLQIKQREFENKKDLFQRDRAILSEKEKISKERELTKLQQEIQHTYETLDTEVKSRQQEDLVNFNRFVEQVVSKFSKQQKYDLILNEQGFLYSNDSLDCTDKLILALDEQFKSKK